MISVACSGCGKTLKAKDQLAGKKVKCPGCGQAVAIPNRVEALTAGASPPSAPVMKTLAPMAFVGPAERGTLPSADQSEGTPSPNPAAAEPDANLTSFLAPAQADNELGRLGGFRILKVLGHGGMGVVFQGEDSTLARKVAIKAMLPHLADSQASQQRFLREARAAAALEHDHIVAILQVATDRGAPFIVMPFLKGEPLDQRLQREPALPVAEVLRIGREIAAGLGAAHAAGLIHRDIKPGNIWLEEPHQRVKILDFGLARAATGESGLTQQGAIMGTPAYMAPEQATGETVDARCDLFSLGCVLYRMATGELPFTGNDTVSTLVAVALENPPPPVELRPGLPGGLSELIMQLLAKKPADRPPTAQAVIDALREIEGDTTEVLSFPVVTARLGKAGGTARRRAARTPLGGAAKRRLRWAWLAGGGVGGLGVLAAAIVLLWPTPRGTVRIESDDPNVEIVFDKTGPTIEGADKEPITLRAGEHSVLVKRGDVTFEADRFVLRRGETIALRLELLQGKVQIVRDGKVVASRDVPVTPNEDTGAGPSPFPPLDRAWLKNVQALAPVKQVEAVAAELKRRNPDFDGKLELQKVEGGQVTQIWVGAVWGKEAKVKDISPLRALVGLKALRCDGGTLSDLSPLKGMKLTALWCTGTKVSDLSPLKGMPLTILHCDGTKVSDLSPLQGMPLTELVCGWSPVFDLSPLKGMKLTWLAIDGTPVVDLSPLQGMPLTHLVCRCGRLSDLSPLKGMPLTHLEVMESPVSDLSPLKGMPLTSLNLWITRVSDLSPLKDMKLTSLGLDGTKVNDLSPVKGMPLTHLACRGAPVTDLSPLQGMPLKAIFFDFKPERDAETLRSLKTLETINDKPAAQFWKEVDGGEHNK